MPFYSYISDLVTGDTWKISRQVNRYDLSLITNAWLTIKSDYTFTDANAEVFKDISTTPNSNGIITNNEDEDYSILAFTILPAETLNIDDSVTYYFDIQVQNVEGIRSTVETGKLYPIKGITDATS